MRAEQGVPLTKGNSVLRKAIPKRENKIVHKTPTLCYTFYHKHFKWGCQGLESYIFQKSVLHEKVLNFLINTTNRLLWRFIRCPAGMEARRFSSEKP